MATRLPELIRKYQDSLLAEWIAEQRAALSRKLIKESELEEQCSAFLRAVGQGASSGDLTTLDGAAWKDMKELLTTMSRTRGQAGYSPSETAMFVLSFKKPLFTRLGKELPAAEVAVANISLNSVEGVAARLDCSRLITSGYLASDRPRLDRFRAARRVEAEGWAADLSTR